MANLTGFDASQVEPAKERQALPAGKYEAIIAASEFKATKAGDGRYLELKFQVVEGEHKGRFVWTRLNLQNPNQVAVKMAQAELSAICRAVNVMQPKDAADLHDLPLVISVKCKKRIDTDEIINEIGGFEKKSAVTSTATSNNNPPW